MNSKLIAIIAVVAMCGAALVGVGYAYTSTLENEGNGTATLKYVTLSDNSAKVVETYSIDYDTRTIDGGDTEHKMLAKAVAGSASGLTPYELTITPTAITGSFDLYMKADVSATGAVENKLKFSVWYSADGTEYTSVITNDSLPGSMTKLNGGSKITVGAEAKTVYLKVSVGNDAGTSWVTDPSASINIDFTFQVTDQNSAQEYA